MNPIAGPGTTTASGTRLQCSLNGAPQFPRSPVGNRSLALVHLRGSNASVVRDITNINHPFTVASPQITQWEIPVQDTVQFASSTDLSESSDGLVRMSFDGASRTTVARHCQGGLVAFAWSADGTKAAYVWETYLAASSGTYSTFEIHVVAGGFDRTIGTAPAWCHCGEGNADIDDMRLAFSPDARLVSWIELTGIASDLQVRRLDGTLVGSETRALGSEITSKYATMSVWSGDALYYRDAHGVEVWRNGSAALFLPGIAWINPRPSPGGGEVIYSARDSSGVSHVFAVNTRSGAVRRLTSGARFLPFYLTPRYIWFAGERSCRSTDPCYFGQKTIATGQTYIYDLTTGVESGSIIAGVADVWPHGA